MHHSMETSSTTTAGVGTSEGSCVVGVAHGGSEAHHHFSLIDAAPADRADEGVLPGMNSPENSGKMQAMDISPAADDDSVPAEMASAHDHHETAAREAAPTAPTFCQEPVCPHLHPTPSRQVE